MLKKAAHNALWLAKGAAIFWGAVMTLALVLGAGTVALAAVPGDPFGLGQTNNINTITRLIGQANSAMLKVDNDSSGASATALKLEVEPGRPPMTVDSATVVQNLNADRVDGLSASTFLDGSDRDDFLPNRTYNKTGATVEADAGEFGTATMDCDAGDKALFGGYSFDSNNFVVLQQKIVGGRYTMVWQTTSATGGTQNDPNVTCADFPPLRFVIPGP